MVHNPDGKLPHNLINSHPKTKTSIKEEINFEPVLYDLFNLAFAMWMMVSPPIKATVLIGFAK